MFATSFRKATTSPWPAHATSRKKYSNVKTTVRAMSNPKKTPWSLHSAPSVPGEQTLGTTNISMNDTMMHEVITTLTASAQGPDVGSSIRAFSFKNTLKSGGICTASIGNWCVWCAISAVIPAVISAVAVLLACGSPAGFLSSVEPFAEAKESLVTLNNL